MSSSDGLDGGKLVVVCGPTAAGKSALAMRLAEVLPITIVSADSRQIYRRFDVGTAKPTCQERDKVPHAGLDLVEPTERFSSFAWATTAIDAIARARAEGRVPVVVGGAGILCSRTRDTRARDHAI
jgi:tRNA dimethylallyltransferase